MVGQVFVYRASERADVATILLKRLRFELDDEHVVADVGLLGPQIIGDRRDAIEWIKRRVAQPQLVRSFVDPMPTPIARINRVGFLAAIRPGGHASCRIVEIDDIRICGNLISIKLTFRNAENRKIRGHNEKNSLLHLRFP